MSGYIPLTPVGVERQIVEAASAGDEAEAIIDELADMLIAADAEWRAAEVAWQLAYNRGLIASGEKSADRRKAAAEIAAAEEFVALAQAQATKEHYRLTYGRAVDARRWIEKRMSGYQSAARLVGMEYAAASLPRQRGG